MEKVITLEEAIQVCEENYLNVQFEMNVEKKLNGEEDYKFVTISPNPGVTVKGKSLTEAVNTYLAENQAQKKKLDEQIELTEEEYNESLYCIECGEDDVKKLAYEANYAGWEKWNCKNCGHGFQVKESPSL